MAKPVALIAGVGDGLSASLARLLHREGYTLVLAARNIDKLAALAEETEAERVRCDTARADDVDALFAAVGTPLRVAIDNPSFRTRGPLIELEPAKVQDAIQVTAFGAFLFAQRQRE